ncbi:kinase-like domain-containing protein [Mycena alexandri]|uniref:Kinase-like domain-containing protein n=1 Tax=Mycena alexandri TaxID=1745969 RepID=A0AAD6WV86_9AGAR|nr:kinase-like domain-containing protein [Mycena alexandri]
MDDEEDLQQTQESTQDQTLARRDLLKDEPDVAVGRNVANAFRVAGARAGNFHAVIRWNGLENAESIITIDDLSSNGTFINGEKIGKGQRRLLKDGNEVAFGAPSTSREADGLFDYRYIFRDLVSFVPKRPVYHAYDISIELGKGSFATVYKALHIASGEWVAVKVIRETKRHNTNPNSTAPPPASSREINIMEELQHPNICGLREVFWNPNGSIGLDLVLELVTGGDLLDFILTRNGLDEPTAKHITYQLCQALAYIHGKGITHRDLKPENVLLTSDTPPIVKVADFGLAKIVDSMTMLKVVTQQGSSGYDSLVDSWSVGVILFSMLTNTTPFIETSHEDLKVRIAERTIDWSQLEGVGLSAEVISFIRNLLEFDPRRRMRLSSALTHPWLEGYELQVAVPLVYPALERTTPEAGGGGMLSEDVSMRTAGSFVDVEAPVLTPREGEGMGEDDAERGEEADAVSQGIEHVRINGSVPSVTAPTHTDAGTDATPNGTTPPPSNTPPGLTLLNRTRGRGVLQRRSEVIQHAAETGRVLVEPSWEMVSYASSQNQNQQQAQEEDALSPSQEELYGPPREGDVCVVPPTPTTTNGAASKNTNARASGSGTTNGNGNGKGPNKRVRAELTPLTEDGEDEHEHEGGTRASSPLSSVGETPPPAGPARKKSRANASQSQESPLNKPAPTKGRRTAKGATGAGAGATRKVRVRELRGAWCLPPSFPYSRSFPPIHTCKLTAFARDRICAPPQLRLP